MIKELENYIVFLKNFSFINLIDNLIELNIFQNSINRVMLIVPAYKHKLDFHNDLNLIQLIEEGLDYIMFEKTQRDL
tara:strand:+ start:574 stop:804 length:231 start_codon:yes stop_codon:yes gene_type:complete